MLNSFKFFKLFSLSFKLGIKPVFYINFFLFALLGNTQNLVPNPSFEDFENCSFIDGQIHFAEPWINPHAGTPDLFNICANAGSTVTSVPDNWVGSQLPRTGNGYAGFFTYTGESIEVREYIQTPLTSPMLANEIYNIEFYVSLSDYSGNATAKFGAFFSVNPISSSNLSALTCCQAQIYTNSHVIESEGWVKISGCYVASGGEEYITIGNFNNDANTDLLNQPSSIISSYYYIDDVSVIHVSSFTFCDNEENDELESSAYFPNVFTPNNDGINDIWSISFEDEYEYVIILNRWGNEIVYLDINNSKWDGKQNGIDCTEGVYFYKAFVKNELKTGFIQLVR